MVPVVNLRALGQPRRAVGQALPGPAAERAAVELDLARATLARVIAARAGLAAAIGPDKAARAEEEARDSVDRARAAYEDARAKGA